MQSAERVEELSPRDAYAALRDSRDCALVDVRTAAELAFVGGPDPDPIGRPVVWVEWAEFPSGRPNGQFVDALKRALGGGLPGRLFFICRSGARSLAAARLVAERMQAEGRPLVCVNVAEGFEGDLDADGHRGTVNGWKVAGLPWRQQ